MNKKDDLKNEGNALRIQKHQLKQVESKIVEVDQMINTIQKDQEENDKLLDILMENMASLLDEQGEFSVSEDEIKNNFVQIMCELEGCSNNYQPTLVSELENIVVDDNLEWNEYLLLVKNYAIKHGLNLDEDPFKHLLTKSQQIELQKKIYEEFIFKNAKCDKYDYMIAGTCGVIGGLVDILFVTTPGKGILGEITDECANRITQQFASFLGWDKEKAIRRNKNLTASAIGFLENKFRVNYDQKTTVETGGRVKHLSTKNHHLKSLAHSPDIIGLIFSILNQFTNTATFINNGEIITIDTENFELQGSNFVSKVFCGFANWFGHIMSDWAGSSGSTDRGTGVPIPFYNLFQLMNFGRFGEKDRETFAIITSKVFEQGYDLRHGMAMAIPVIITELLIRFMYTMKAHFYHGKSWKDSIPKTNIPELRRMLLIGHGILCLLDGIDAAARSKSNLVSFLLRTNLIGWVRMGQFALKELSAWYNTGHIDPNLVDKYLEEEYKRMLAM